MRKTCFILFAFILTACASQAPLDDAYHWPDKKANTAVSETSSTSSSSTIGSTVSTAPARTTTPSMEVISAKDTTITVRIKR